MDLGGFPVRGNDFDIRISQENIHIVWVTVVRSLVTGWDHPAHHTHLAVFELHFVMGGIRLDRIQILLRWGSRGSQAN
jgi:hypothetical protein